MLSDPNFQEIALYLVAFGSIEKNFAFRPTKMKKSGSGREVFVHRPTDSKKKLKIHIKCSEFGYIRMKKTVYTQLSHS